MRTLGLGRWALCAAAAAAVLSGCKGGATSMLPFTQAAAQDGSFQTSPRLHVIYWFPGIDRGATAGWGPHALVSANGMLYGATAFGGKYGYGAVFEVSTSGQERVIYSFKGNPDGSEPLAGLVALKGDFYGTTALGGRYGGGTVFRVSPDGRESVLHSFRGRHDGSTPDASLVLLDGKLYGTTLYGGGNGNSGTVFEITPVGGERIVHRFGGPSEDGASLPIGGLAVLRGTLYGAVGSILKGAGGALFSLAPSGTYRTMHRFTQYEGVEPAGTLVAVDGALYGATTGQIGPEHKFESGVVYKLLPRGRLRILARVGSESGGNPKDGLTVLDQNFFGVSGNGGAYGAGGVFEVTPSGAEHTVCWFRGEPDGHSPTTLTTLDGRLYGAMSWGGEGRGHGGTIFEVQPYARNR